VVRSTKRARLAAVLRWLAPSAAAAASGALIGGLVEGLGMSSGLGITAAAGFVAIVTLPILIATSIVVRGLWAAWRPQDLALVEDDGSAPRLAAWTAVLWLSALGLAWALFQGTWMLASFTAFKPISLSFAEPVLAVGSALVLVVLSRPLARGLIWLYRKLDARWRRRVSWSIVSPRTIAISVTVKTLVAGYAVWRLLVKPKLGPLDLSLLHVPLAALAGTLATHLVWSRLGARARRPALALIGLTAVAMIGGAVFAWRTRPSLTLAIGGERPLAGLAIDKLRDLVTIRARRQISPRSPTASGFSSSSSTWTSQPGIGRPIDPSRTSIQGKLATIG
jgi:hypothetical protein